MTLDEVVHAVELEGISSRPYYDLVTHEIVWLDDIIMAKDEREAVEATLDEHGWIRLPKKLDIDEYVMMKDFAEVHHFSESFSKLKGRDALRRFVNALQRLGLEQEWLKFLKEQYRRISLEWCKECGIELSDEDE